MHLRMQPLLSEGKSRWYRVLECVPGTLLWATFVLSFVLSYVRPLWVIIFIIALSVLWLLRVVYFVIYVSIAWKQYRQSQRRDWLAELQRSGNNWRSLLHVVVLPTYTEPLEVLDRTISSLAASSYPTERIMVVLAGEQRDEAQFQEYASTLVQRYQRAFFDILVTLHPAGLPGELEAKGSNAHWAGMALEQYCHERRIAPEDVIVSYFDCDTCVSSNYFAALTVTFLAHPKRLRSAYQPLSLYNNNMWNSPLFNRVSAFATTFWLMTELPRPERLLTFSSHAMSMRALVDVGFWSTSVVTDDTRIFWDCLLHYGGDFRVVPLYAAVSMNTAATSSWWRSMRNLYTQQRRWAWSIENLIYIAWQFPRHPEIPFSLKRRFLWNLAEGYYMWAAAPILLFLLGRLPLLIIQWRDIQPTILAYNTPHILEYLMSLAMIGILVSIVVSTTLLPTLPLGRHPFQRLAIVFQWALLPVSLILFGSLPAIEAQTRLMLGRYLGFHVTEKDSSSRTPYSHALRNQPRHI